MGFESLDAGSTVREAPNRGEAFSGEVQSIGVLVNRTEHMGKWVSDARFKKKQAPVETFNLHQPRQVLPAHSSRINHVLD